MMMVIMNSHIHGEMKQMLKYQLLIQIGVTIIPYPAILAIIVMHLSMKHVCKTHTMNY